MAGERVAQPQDDGRRRLHESGKRSDRGQRHAASAGRAVGLCRPRSRRWHATTLPSADKTLGYYVQEQATLRDRLFVTVALRTDQNSAFGSNVDEHHVSEGEPLVDRVRRAVLPAVRMAESVPRSRAYGASGIQPRATDAFVTYTAPVVSINGIGHAGPARAVARQSVPQAGAHDGVRRRLRHARARAIA